MSAVHEVTRKPLPAHAEGSYAPDYEVPEQGTAKPMRLPLGSRATGWAVSDRIDRIYPPHKRIFGRSRRTVFIVFIVIVLLLLALVIGLAVGLTKQSKSRNLPLPGGAEIFTGDLTYYDPGLGACGKTSSEDENIVSISHFVFDDVQTGTDPNQNPLCGRKLRAQREYKGKRVSVDLTVVDRCTGCEPTDIDVSPAVFDKLAYHDLGRVRVRWAWL